METGVGSGKSRPKDQVAVALHYYYTSPSRWCTTHEVSKLLISQRLPHYQPAHFYPCSDADIAKAGSRPSSARSATAATACRSYIARRVGRRTDVSATWYDVGRLRPDRQTHSGWSVTSHRSRVFDNISVYSTPSSHGVHLRQPIGLFVPFKSRESVLTTSSSSLTEIAVTPISTSADRSSPMLPPRPRPMPLFLAMLLLLLAASTLLLDNASAVSIIAIFTTISTSQLLLPLLLVLLPMY